MPYRTGMCSGALLAGLLSATASAQSTFFDHQAGFLKELEAPQSGTVAQTVRLSAAEFQTLKSSPVGQPIDLPALRLGLAKGADFTLKRVQVRAEGARTYVQSAAGLKTIRPSARQFFVGQSATGGVGFSLDPATGRVHGLLVEGRKSYQLDSVQRKGGGIELSVVGLDEGRQKSGFSCGLNESHTAHLDFRKGPLKMPPSMRALTKGGGDPLFQAVVAVDTDNEFLFNKFGNNVTAAQVGPGYLVQLLQRSGLRRRLLQQL
ncbi:MAG: hypothetical protein AAGA23_22570 [Pseudomonadota bacterium]